MGQMGADKRAPIGRWWWYEVKKEWAVATLSSAPHRISSCFTINPNVSLLLAAFQVLLHRCVVRQSLSPYPRLARFKMSPALINGTTNGLHGDQKGPHDGFGTRAIHVGSEPNPETGAVIPSISLSTTYKQDSVGNHKVRFSHCSIACL